MVTDTAPVVDGIGLVPADVKILEAKTMVKKWDMPYPRKRRRCFLQARIDRKSLVFLKEECTERKFVETREVRAHNTII